MKLLSRKPFAVWCCGVALAGVVYSYGGELALNLNWPGLGLRWHLTEGLAVELRGQYDPQAQVWGGRGYWYINRSAVSLYSGLEAGAAVVSQEDLEATGYTGLVFVGMEYRFLRRLSLQVDAGPAWVALRSTADSGLASEGLEYVINVGLNWYLWGARR